MGAVVGVGAVGVGVGGAAGGVPPGKAKALGPGAALGAAAGFMASSRRQCGAEEMMSKAFNS